MPESVRLKHWEQKLNAVLKDERGEERWVELPTITHCSGLHDKIAGLLHIISGTVELPLIECACCGQTMVAQVEGNSPFNMAMEVCSMCLSLIYEDGEHHVTP